MKTVELFSGTQSFSKVMRKYGHETFCVDNNPDFKNDLTLDLMGFKAREKVFEYILKRVETLRGL